MTRERCSIVIPVHNKAALTRQCLDSIYANPPAVDHEVLVVDDASTDETPAMLAEYGDALRHVRLERNAGFATACNTGAAAAEGDYLVFLNNDTIAQPGWLDALAAYADSHDVAVVGSKLLYPDGSIQHAGVAFSPLGDPLHIYAGFPADHPAVNKPRPFQAVTAACVLVRRDAFDQVGGFDTGYHNDLEDVDLCLRLGQSGHEVHYCPESVLYHLESASRGQRNRPKQSAHVYRDRWGRCVRHDELVFYVEDGMLELLRAPNQLASPWTRWRTEAHLVHTRMNQILELLRETARAAVYEARNGEATASTPLTPPERRRMRKRIRETKRELATAVPGVPMEDQPASTTAVQEPAAPEPAVDSPPDESHEPTEPAAAAPAPEPDQKAQYDELVGRITATLEGALPADANVLVVSKGDDRLLQVRGRRCHHFPQDEAGNYLGYYPKTGADALRLLAAAEAAGAEYFVLPATAMWWLDHYEELAQRLAEAQILIDQPDLCLVFQLAEDAVLPDVVRSLLPSDARLAVVCGPSGPGMRNVMLFPHDLGEQQAIEHLSRMGSIGVQFLIVPRECFNWLAARPLLAEHLRTQHRFVTRQDHACEIYELVAAPAPAAVAAGPQDAAPAQSTGAHGGRSRTRRLFRRPARRDR